MARKKVYNLILDDLKKNNLSHIDIKYVIPHQASGMAVKAYFKYGGFKEKQVINIIDKTGNCVAASIPLALVTVLNKNKINKGDLLYLIGTGAGLSIASLIIKI